MTPTQLRAFAAVVRLGSVKQAAAELDVSEAAVSLHIGQLRKELGDKLFTRTAAGIAFTPGGLRLASRAAEMLGLQDRTILEVSQAGKGRRLLRVAASSLFAEHSAPGLIELFASRADDLDVELERAQPAPVRPTAADPRGRRRDRPADRPTPDDRVASAPFLNYQVVAVAGPDDQLTKITATVSELQDQTWLLGPSVADQVELVAAMLRRLQIPESRQQIFQSHAAALEEAKRGKGIAVALAFAVSHDLAKGDLKRVSGPQLHAQGTWHILTLRRAPRPAGRGRVRPVRDHAAGHPGDAARRRRHRRPVPAVDPRDAVELTAPGEARDHTGQRAERVGRQQLVAVRQRRGHRRDGRLEPGRGGPRVHPDHPVRAAPQPGHRRRELLGRVAVPPVRADETIAPRSALPWCEASSACRLVAIRVPPNRSTTFAVACSIAVCGRSGARARW